MTPRCKCEQPNPACTRAGAPMVGRLWELCRGINCTVVQSEAYRRAWDGQPLPEARPACRHRGETVGEEECPACAGRVRIKLFACALHQVCTTHKPLTNVACCGECLDYGGPEER